MKKRFFSGVVVIAATVLALAWWLGWIGEDPALAEVKTLQAQLENPNLSDAEFRAAMEQIRSKTEPLSESSRRLAWQNGRQAFERREMSRIDRILAMKPQDRAKALDDEINRMERRRAEWQQRTSQGQTGGQRGGARGSRNRGTPSDEQRISRIRNRLDRSSPEQRAKRTEFARLMNERRAQRGLPPMQRGRG
jgi:hypothetical protein